MAFTTSGLTKQTVLSRFLLLPSPPDSNFFFRRQSRRILRQQRARSPHNHPLSSSLHRILPRHPRRHRENVSVASSTSHTRGIQQSHREEPRLDFLWLHVPYEEYLYWWTEVLFVFVEWRYGLEVWCTVAADYGRRVCCCVRYFVVDAWYWWVCRIGRWYRWSACVFFRVGGWGSLPDIMVVGEGAVCEMVWDGGFPSIRRFILTLWTLCLFKIWLSDSSSWVGRSPSEPWMYFLIPCLIERAVATWPRLPPSLMPMTVPTRYILPFRGRHLADSFSSHGHTAQRISWF